GRGTGVLAGGRREVGWRVGGARASGEAVGGAPDEEAECGEQGGTQQDVPGPAVSWCPPGWFVSLPTLPEPVRRAKGAPQLGWTCTPRRGSLSPPPDHHIRSGGELAPMRPAQFLAALLLVAAPARGQGLLERSRQEPARAPASSSNSDSKPSCDDDDSFLS